jgi:hypothetical protein
MKGILFKQVGLDGDYFRLVACDPASMLSELVSESR